MDWKSEWKRLTLMIGLFLLLFWLPTDRERFTNAVMESLHLSRWYAREHVLLCLIPAFFIAGAIGVFISQASVMRYLGVRANKTLAYGVASVSGSILAVCSCTVLPLFAGIWRMGAGLGPACAFLYSGPAINVLAVILTARILGIQLGIARAVGAIVFSIVIGLIMHLFFRKEEDEKAQAQLGMPEPEVIRPLWQNAIFLGLMVAILVFANWGAPNDQILEFKDGRQVRAAVVKAPEDASKTDAVYTLKILDGEDQGREIRVMAAEISTKQFVPGIWTILWRNKWKITAMLAMGFGCILVLWFAIPWWKVVLVAMPPLILVVILPTEGLWVLLPFSAAMVGFSILTSTQPGETEEWFAASWSFAKQILPLLLLGVLVAGLLLGRPDHEGLIPSKIVRMLVGTDPDMFLETTGISGSASEGVVRTLWPLWTNFFASVFGAFMYFATLTEVPILQGLLGAGMGKGPALALLLAGPALSLPNMLVIRSVMGTKKTVVFCSLVVIMATVTGILFGAFWGAT